MASPKTNSKIVAFILAVLLALGTGVAFAQSPGTTSSDPDSASTHDADSSDDDSMSADDDSASDDDSSVAATP